MKNYEILDALSKLNKIKESTTKYPIALGYKIYKNIGILEKSLEPYEKMRSEIFTKYSNGKDSITPEDDCYFEVMNEIKELGNQEVEDISLSYISLDEFKDLNFSMEEIMGLSVMIKEQTDELD